MRFGWIYGLIDPETDEIRYVGQTFNLKERYQTHCKCYSNIKSHSRNWIFSLKQKNLKPELLVLEENCQEDIIDKLEQFYISLFKSWGFNLTNHDLGGRSTNRKMSLDGRKRINKDRKGVKYSKEKAEFHSEILKRINNKPVYYIDRNLLYELYITKNLSKKEISSITDIPERTIKRRVSLFGFKKDKDKISINISRGQISSSSDILYLEKIKNTIDRNKIEKIPYNQFIVKYGKF